MSINPKEHYVPKYCIYKLNNIVLYHQLTPYGRIRYLGKSYRLRYKRKKHYFNFEMSRNHWTKLYLGVTKLAKYKKNFYIYRVPTHYDNYIMRMLLKKVRRPNKYTKRGLRITRAKFLKRYGKISQAFTKLH